MGFGPLFEMAMGVGREWMSDGRCHGWGRRTENADNPNPWFVANNENFTLSDGTVLKGAELVKYALITCAGCEAQYDCARFAVRTNVDVGTSSMGITSLRWLQKQGDWERIVDIAELATIPIQVAVKTLRNGESLAA